MTRVLLAFAFSALWLPLLIAFVAPEYDFFWSKMVGAFTMAFTLLIAAPGYLVFRKHITFALCLVGGALASILGAAMFLSFTNWSAFLNTGPLMAFVGLITGLGFWAIGFAGSQKSNNSLQPTPYRDN